MPIRTFTAVLHKERDLYVAECPEVGTVSQGKTVEEAITNLTEATELYLEEFPPENPSHTPINPPASLLTSRRDHGHCPGLLCELASRRSGKQAASVWQ